MENKGKVKYKNKAFRRTTHALIVSSGIFFGVIFAGIPFEMQASDAKNEMLDICENVEVNDDALEYYRDKYEKHFTAGFYAPANKEFLEENIEKEAKLNYVLDNAEECVSDKSDYLKSLKDSHDENLLKSRLVSGCGFTASMLSIISACIMRKNNKFDEKEM